MAGLLGLAAASGEWRADPLCGLAGATCLLFPFAEEPWLEQAHGEPYKSYRNFTPRFLGLAKILKD
jgi:protein-S-isoprenylcysteine O-methyltransferase Ste14